MAKVLHPEMFADVDPDKTSQDFYREYLPVVPQGAFFLYP